jgi:hypothetical protein
MSWMNFLNIPNPSSCLGFTQPLTEMSTISRKAMFLRTRGCRRVRMTTPPPSVSRMCRQCGILNMSQPYRPPRPVTGIALLLIGESKRPCLRPEWFTSGERISVTRYRSYSDNLVETFLTSWISCGAVTQSRLALSCLKVPERLLKHRMTPNAL